MNPTTSAKTRESSTPSHMLVVNWKANIDANNAEAVTATPADRSNSPPIMSSATDRRDAVRGADIEDRRERIRVPERRRDREEHEVDDDGDEQRPHLGPGEKPG